jgi:hypothetical protein
MIFGGIGGGGVLQHEVEESWGCWCRGQSGREMGERGKVGGDEGGTLLKGRNEEAVEGGGVLGGEGAT